MDEITGGGWWVVGPGGRSLKIEKREEWRCMWGQEVADSKLARIEENDLVKLLVPFTIHYNQCGRDYIRLFICYSSMF